MSLGGENIPALANRSSFSELTSVMDKKLLWPEISLSHETNGTTLVLLVRSLRSLLHEPVTNL